MIRSASLRRSEDRSGERFLTYDPSDRYSGSAIAGHTCGFFLNIVRSMCRLLVDDVLPFQLSTRSLQLSEDHRRIRILDVVQQMGETGLRLRISEHDYLMVHQTSRVDTPYWDKVA